MDPAVLQEFPELAELIGEEPEKDPAAYEPVVFSIITPVFDTPPEYLRDCIDSVLAQDYPYWELCLVDDASTNPETLDVLNHYAHHDTRIRVRRRDENGGISRASNDGLVMATGSWVALLDHDDMLHPSALGALGHILFHEPETDVLYTDEDKFRERGQHFDQYYKPPWSPEALLAQMYIGHLTAYRASVVDAAGGFRVGYEGSQDWDLALRVTELTTRIRHVELVLYHWRVHPESTASGQGAKDWAYVAAKKALEDALARRHIDGWIEELTDIAYFRVRRRLPSPLPLVSVVIPTAGGRREVEGESILLVERCIEGLLNRTSYDALEIIVVLSEGTDPDVVRRISSLAGERVRFLGADGPFSFSRAVNRGAVRSSGEFVLLLNDDIDPIGEDWLTLLVEAALDPEIGAVGPRLLFADGTVQHAGVVHNDALPFHLNRLAPNGPGYFSEVALTRNYLAVTGACLLTRRSRYEEVGGLSDLFPMNYNDIDYCLKLHQHGYRTVYVGQAQLFHYESSTRPPTVTVSECHAFQQMWRDVVEPDFFLAPQRLGLPARA